MRKLNEEELNTIQGGEITIAAVMTVILSLNFLAEVVGAIILVPVYSKILKKVAR